MSNTKYRVEWVSKITGKQGFGMWQDDLAAVTIAVNEGNAEFPDITHKIGFGYGLPDDVVGCEVCGHSTMDSVPDTTNFTCPSCGWHC